MSIDSSSQLNEKLTRSGAEHGIKGFIARISKAFQGSHLTISKLLRMYAIVEDAVRQLETIAKEK